MEVNKELILKLKGAKDAGELIEIAKAFGKELGKEEAEKLFAKLHADGELNDDALNDVSGAAVAPWQETTKPFEPVVASWILK